MLFHEHQDAVFLFEAADRDTPNMNVEGVAKPLGQNPLQQPEQELKSKLQKAQAADTAHA